MTLFGYFFVPVALLFFLLPPVWLISLVIFASVFEAASVYNTASFGLPPYYFGTLLIAVRLIWHLLTKEKRIGKGPWLQGHLTLLALFVSWSVLSVLVLIELFEGIPVFTARGGIDSQVGAGTPLTLTISNLAQVVYLLLNAFFVCYVLLTIRHRASFRVLERWFLITGCAVILLGLYQVVVSTLGLPYPYAFLQSNQLRFAPQGNTSAGLLRISSTYTESSNFAMFGTGFLTYLLFRYLRSSKRPFYLLVVLCLSILAMLLSTSSTAYIGLGITGTLVALFALYRALRNRKVSLVLLLLSFTLPVTAAAIVFNSEALQTVVQRAVVEKSQSGSFASRLAADRYSLVLAEKTYGLGVGLGSNRPSSFAAWLLSNVGLPGLLLFLGSVITLGLALDKSSNGSGEPVGSNLYWALVALLLAKVLSSPDLSTPIMWVCWALCLGAASTNHLQAGQSLRLTLFAHRHTRHRVARSRIRG